MNEQTVRLDPARLRQLAGETRAQRQADDAEQAAEEERQRKTSAAENLIADLDRVGLLAGLEHVGPDAWSWDDQSYRPHPVVTIDGIRFYRDGQFGNDLYAAVPRIYCRHWRSMQVSRRDGERFLLDLGYLLEVDPLPCDECRFEQEQNAPAPAKPVPPSIAQELEGAVLRLVRAHIDEEGRFFG